MVRAVRHAVASTPSCSMRRRRQDGHVKPITHMLLVCYSIMNSTMQQSLADQPGFCFTADELSLPPALECLATYAEPDMDIEHWRPLLLQAVDLLASRPLWEPAEDSPFYQAVQRLVPWTLRKLQVNRTPKQNRFFVGVPHSHRGCALLYADQDVAVLHEDLGADSRPHQRFNKPVNVGIFWAGTAPVLHQPDELVADGDFRLVRCSPGVTIRISKDSNMPEEVCRMVAKLHCALGHPSQQDLTDCCQVRRHDQRRMLFSRVYAASFARDMRNPWHPKRLPTHRTMYVTLGSWSVWTYFMCTT
eukprot:773010-Amphidinium_carterae.3